MHTLNNWGSIFIQSYFYVWLSFIYCNPVMLLCKDISTYFHKTCSIVIKLHIYLENFTSVILYNMHKSSWLPFTNLSLRSIFTVNITLSITWICNNYAISPLLLWLLFRISSIFCGDTLLGIRSIDSILCKGLSSTSNLTRLSVTAGAFSAKTWKVSFCN